MNHSDEIGSYAVKLIKEGMDKYWDTLDEANFIKQGLNIPAIKCAKEQIFCFQINMAAYVHNLKIEGYKVNELMPVEYSIYNYLMTIAPNIIVQIALMAKYVNEGIPHELVLTLVKGNK